MTDSVGVLQIKQELDTSSSGMATASSSCCSPSTSSTSTPIGVVVGSSNRCGSSYSNSNSAITNSNNCVNSHNHNNNGAPSSNSSQSLELGSETIGSGGGSNGGNSSTLNINLSKSMTSVKSSSPSVSPDRQLCSSTTMTLSNDMHSVSKGGEGLSSGMSIVATSGTGSGSNSIRDELRRLCLVCGDIASGFHYGVASCEACKAFFKRTIQGNIEYTCPANNECEINKRRRKACQACRFQKCLVMGMLKEGVRLDRVRGGRQKYRRNPVSNSYQTMHLLYQSSTVSLEDVKILEVLNSYEPDALTVNVQQTQPNSTTSDLTNSQKANCNVNMSSRAKMEGASNVIGGKATTSSSSISCILQNNNNNNNNNNGNSNNNNNNNNINNNNSSNKNNNSKTIGSQEILSVISDLYDKELVGVIGWAKQIPGFIDLPLNDQMKLLKASWAEILTLQLIFRSLPFNGKFCFATDVWMDEHLAKDCGYSEFYYHCVQIAERVERLSPRREEYYMLKALMLSNCDTLLDDQSSLRSFRETILNAFNDVVYLLRHSSAVTHQQQLLLLLPSLRQADGILRCFWRNICRDGCVIMKKLFVEMLQSVPR